MAPGLDVFPGDAIADVVDGAGINAQLRRELQARGGTLFDHQDRVGGELGVPASFSNGKSVAFKSISVVIRSVSPPQVGRLDADRTVARMQNALARRDGAKEDLVRGAVGLDLVTVDAELSVVAIIGYSTPVPAPFGKRGCRGRVSRHEPPEDSGHVQPSWPMATSSAKGGSVPAPPHVMSRAVSAQIDGVAADRAVHFFMLEGP